MAESGGLRSSVNRAFVSFTFKTHQSRRPKRFDILVTFHAVRHDFVDSVYPKDSTYKCAGKRPIYRSLFVA